MCENIHKFSSYEIFHYTYVRLYNIHKLFKYISKTLYHICKRLLRLVRMISFLLRMTSIETVILLQRFMFFIKPFIIYENFS